MCSIMSPAMKDSFLFQSRFVISFSSLIAIPMTSRITLSNSGESGHPCLFPHLRGDALSYSPLRIMPESSNQCSDNLVGWNGVVGGREVQEGGDICIPMADSR